MVEFQGLRPSLYPCEAPEPGSLGKLSNLCAVSHQLCVLLKGLNSQRPSVLITPIVFSPIEQSLGDFSNPIVLDDVSFPQNSQWLPGPWEGRYSVCHCSATLPKLFPAERGPQVPESFSHVVTQPVPPPVTLSHIPSPRCHPRASVPEARAWAEDGSSARTRGFWVLGAEGSEARGTHTHLRRAPEHGCSHRSLWAEWSGDSRIMGEGTGASAPGTDVPRPAS